MKAEEFTGIGRLAALHAIKLLKARRNRAADTKDWALYESLHAPEHHSWNEDYPLTTTAAEMIAVTRKAMMKGLSRWKQVGEDHWFQGFGFCHETYEKQKGGRLFTSRMVTRTHAHISTGAQSAPIAGR